MELLLRPKRKNMAKSKLGSDGLQISPTVVDTHQDHTAVIDYRLILLFLVVAAILFGV